MQYEELKRRLAEWDLAIVPRAEVRVRGFDLDAYRKLARQTEEVDYDCDFNNGVCQARAMGGYGCCWQCAGSFGYWRREERALDEETVKLMAELFDEGTGFLKEGEGCVLPREMRSPTCLYIYCSDEKMSGKDKELLFRLHYGANWG